MANVLNCEEVKAGRREWKV